MNVIVVGCGRVGSELAYRLFKMGHQVTVVDITDNAFNNLPPDFVGRRVEGEILARDTWHRADIEHADALAAVTNSDAVNAVVGHMARSIYHVTNVVVRNYDPQLRAIHDAFGLQVVSSSSWGAQRMAELLLPGALPAVFSAGNGEVEIYELVVPSAWHGHTIAELIGPYECIAVALTRSGRAMLPSRDTRLEEGDVLHIGATDEGILALQQRLQNPPMGTMATTA